MFKIGLLPLGVPRTINFAQYGHNIDLGKSVAIGRTDTQLFVTGEYSLRTATIGSVGTGLSLYHEQFEFGLSLPGENYTVALTVSSLVHGSEIRICKSIDYTDLVQDDFPSVLRVPEGIDYYDVATPVIPCRQGRYIFFEKGAGETLIHGVSVHSAMG
ncbi:hypothetical protein QTO30_10225 [Yoonia sp. GPGPB17]|uniref:hypothetical protein n=1 Tax=Yoonia sp. GPGPB17 TaxID=3026147 RepID=UPI0030BD6F0C